MQAIFKDLTIWKSPFTFKHKIFIEENVDMEGHGYGLLPFSTIYNVYTSEKLVVNLISSMMGYMLHHIIGESPKKIRV